MRRTNLDEMPHFFTVFTWDMSVFGPRPHPIQLDTGLANEMQEYILRHYTKPGITGWAQVNGFRGPTETKEAKEGRTSHDIWYLRNWSFFLDLKIVFLTVFGKKTQENAF
jgi:putative colanic acid biosynthesis UDP-glucose lipid carrier transferase